MPSRQRVLDRLGLVRVKLRDAARRQRTREPLIEPLGKRRELRGDCRQSADGRDGQVWRIGTFGERRAGEALQRRVEIVLNGSTSRGQHGRGSYQPAGRRSRGESRLSAQWACGLLAGSFMTSKQQTALAASA